MSAAASSAFPQPAPDAMDAQYGYVTKQNEMVPGWYRMNPHRDPENTVVKQDGAPLLPQFTVAEIAHGRRWVVGMDGELMSQVDFKIKLSEVRLEYYALLRSQGRNAQYVGDVTYESVPSVRKFASMKVDLESEGESKLMDVHYDPYATAGAKPKGFVDKQGEKLKGSRLEILRSAYRDVDLHQTLKANEVSEVEATLTAQEVLDIRASWDVVADVADGGEASGLKDKLDRLGTLLADGKMTEDAYKGRVAALVGAPAPEPQKAEPKKRAKRAAPKMTTACGESIYNLHKNTHIRKCEKPECVAKREATD